MPTIGRKAIEDAQVAAKRFLRRAKYAVDTGKKRDLLKTLAADQYDAAAYVTRIALANKAQAVLNRVGVALREGRLNANEMDRDVLRSVVGGALEDWKADLMLQNILRTAYNAGRYEQQMDDDTRTMLLYRTMRDGKVRPGHARLDGTLLPKEHAFWQMYYPPNGHNCRCRVDSLTGAQAADLARRSPRIRTEPPEDRQVAYIDKVTGKRITQPESIDPGWAGRPDASASSSAKLLERSIVRLNGCKPI